MNEITKSKSIFRSKSVFAGALVALAGALGTFAPDFAPWLAAHADVVLMGAGILQVGLRILTKGRVTLFAESD
jgi:hypothetical protein